MFGAMGKAMLSICLTFVSKAAIEHGVSRDLKLAKKVVPVKNCRKIGKKDLVLNGRTPKIKVDPETYEVRVDGRLATVEPAEKLSLARTYNLF
jgi:urease subunit alpha